MKIWRRQSTGVIINEYAIPTASSQPYEITLGPDGALWFTENTGNKIGRITTAGAVTEYPIPTPGSLPVGITVGPDGALWFTESAANKIGRIDPVNKGITEYPVPTAHASPYGITRGPDNALWFTETGSGKIGRMTTAGVVTEYSLPTSVGLDQITAGPDGALWFDQSAGGMIGYGSIGRITTAGVVNQYAGPYGFYGGLTPGPDGALWYPIVCEVFAGCHGDAIGRVATDGTSTSYPVVAAAGPYAITLGPDGALWFTEETNRIGRITLAGVFSEFPAPAQGFAITAGTDRLWFTEQNANRIGAILPGSSATVNLTGANFPASGGTGTATITVTPANATWSALGYDSWITAISGPTFTGSGTLTYSVAANNSISARSGTLAIAGQQFTVTQAGMLPSFSISPTSADVSASGAANTVTVTATPPDATWTAGSNTPWITITSGTSGTGSGTVGYFSTANPSVNARSGTLTIAGLTFTVTQAGVRELYPGALLLSGHAVPRGGHARLRLQRGIRTAQHGRRRSARLSDLCEFLQYFALSRWLIR